MMRFLIITLLSFLLVFLSFDCRAQIIMPREPVILAWYSLRPPVDTPKGYKDLRNAGFNYSFSYFNSLDEAEQSLKNAENTSIKVIVSTHEIKHETLTATSRLKRYKSLAGYHLKDEPSVEEMVELDSIKKLIESNDMTHLCYVNLFPIYAGGERLGAHDYRQYLYKYYEMLSPSLLSFDHYPIRTDGFREDYYKNLQLVSSFCKQKALPFWGFVMSAGYGVFPEPTLAGMSLQAYSNIAYGASGIQYFTYCSPGPMEFAPINYEGNKTDVYARIVEINHNIKKIYRVLSGVEYDTTYLIGGIVNGEEEPRSVSINDCKIICNIGKGFLVSNYNRKNKRYMLIVNRNYDSFQSISLAPERKAKVLFGGKKIIIKREEHFNVSPGSALLIRVF